MRIPFRRHVDPHRPGWVFKPEVPVIDGSKMKDQITAFPKWARHSAWRYAGRGFWFIDELFVAELAATFAADGHDVTAHEPTPRSRWSPIEVVPLPLYSLDDLRLVLFVVAEAAIARGWHVPDSAAAFDAVVEYLYPAVGPDRPVIDAAVESLLARGWLTEYPGKGWLMLAETNQYPGCPSIPDELHPLLDDDAAAHR